MYNEVSIDRLTGEAMHATTVRRYPAEPIYAKVYFENLPKGLNGKCFEVLNDFAKRMTYSGDSVDGNSVSINSPIGDKIAEEFGITTRHLRRIISTLVAAGALRKIGCGKYQVNPYLFGKGEWGDIAKLRDIWGDA